MLSSGLVSITFRQLTPEAIIGLVCDAGLRGIEWGGDVHVPHGDLERASKVGQMTREAGLKVAAYGSYFRVGQSEQNGLPFSQVVDSARKMGAPVIRVWAGPAGSAEMDSSERGQVVEELRRMAELAAKAGVRVATEFHGGTLTDTNESAKRLLLEVDHPNLSTYWQPLMGMSDETCVEAIGQLSPWLSHLHVYHWSSFKERCALAAGAERWQKFLQAAREIPGDRYAMLEFVKDDAPENFLRDAATLHEWLKT